MVCNWWHSVPQLFYRIGLLTVTGSTSTCADVWMLPKYFKLDTLTSAERLCLPQLPGTAKRLILCSDSSLLPTHHRCPQAFRVHTDCALHRFVYGDDEFIYSFVPIDVTVNATPSAALPLYPEVLGGLWSSIT